MQRPSGHFSSPYRSCSIVQFHLHSGTDSYRLLSASIALWDLRHGKTAAALLPPLLSRFAEVVVDEAQDCSAADLAILQLLHDAGLPLVLVGDPDQAITPGVAPNPRLSSPSSLSSLLPRTA
ncbi:UvrD-helicase domain-containing protein [Streptomyces sp. ZG43]